MNMSAEPSNVNYYYPAGLHLPAQGQMPFYANPNQMIGGQYRYNQELNESGHVYNSQNYYAQPSISRNAQHPFNIGSNHGLYHHEDTDGHFGRSRADSINFLPIPSLNFDDNNYPHLQDQIVSSTFQNDLNHCIGPHSQQNLQPISHNQQNYHMDGKFISFNNIIRLIQKENKFIRNRNSPFSAFVPSHHQNIVGSSTVLHTNPNEMIHAYNNYPHPHQYSMMQNSQHHNLNYLNSNYQIPMTSQQYLMNDASNVTQQHPSSMLHPHHYLYSNTPPSLHNLGFEGENTQIGAQDEKLSTFQQVPELKNVLESPKPKTKKKAGKKDNKLKSEVFNSENESSELPNPHLKTTEKVKRKYTESTDVPKKNEAKEDAISNDENTPVVQTLNAKRPSQTPKKKKSKTLSEATTNFDQNSDVHTPTLKENAYKKQKIQEKDKQVQSSSSAEQTSAKTDCSEQTIQATAKTGLLALPHEKMIDQLKIIMKSLPPAYLPFLHKKQTDYQKLDYLKKNHHVQFQSDLNKIRSVLPSNFIDYFDVSIESVYQNTYIMNGIIQNMPDEQSKKIGTLTRKERREKINKYKIKRDKRACRKISYDVRKRVADSRLRVKGRFVTKEQALQMIGDVNGDPDKYTNQELRELLYQKFGGENGDNTKKESVDDNENQKSNLVSINYEEENMLFDGCCDDQEEKDEKNSTKKKLKNN